MPPDLAPRTDDPARLTFQPLEPFLVEGNVPVRPGQIRRASLLPIWQWLIRDGAPDAHKEFEAELARLRESGTRSELDKAVSKFQLIASEAIARIAPVSAFRTTIAESGYAPTAAAAASWYFGPIVVTTWCALLSNTWLNLTRLG